MYLMFRFNCQSWPFAYFIYSKSVWLSGGETYCPPLVQKHRPQEIQILLHAPMQTCTSKLFYMNVGFHGKQHENKCYFSMQHSLHINVKNKVKLRTFTLSVLWITSACFSCAQNCYVTQHQCTVTKKIHVFFIFIFIFFSGSQQQTNCFCHCSKYCTCPKTKHT